MIKQTEILVIGGGPAGLSAACAAAELGASVLLCERDYLPGGQSDFENLLLYRYSGYRKLGCLQY